MRRFWLLVLLCASLCLANSTVSRCNRSISARGGGTWHMFKFWFRPGAAADDPASLAKRKAADEAYYEAMDIAGLAYDELDEDDPIFQRYFRRDDFQLVKEIYGSITGALDNNRDFGSPDITKLSVYEGSADYTPGVCDAGTLNACLLQNIVYPTAQNFPGLAPDEAAMSTCDAFYAHHLLAERRCEDIFGDNDSFLMLSRGSLMLHELTHWRTLTAKSTHFQPAIRDRLGLDHIADYAYGAWRAQLLARSGYAESAANADSYAYHALSKYWQKKCPEKNGGRGWGTAVDEDRPGPGLDSGRCRDVYDGYVGSPQVDCAQGPPAAVVAV